MHMSFLLIIVIYLAKKTQITLLVVKKIKISSKYSDFLDFFLKKKVLSLSVATNLNQYAIKLQKSQQLLYRSIYSQSLVKL